MFVLRPVIATDRSLLEANPALWRKVRRFNDQGQLAVAVALEAARGAANAPTMGLVGLAGCQSGSEPDVLDDRELPPAPLRIRTPTSSTRPTHCTPLTTSRCRSCPSNFATGRMPFALAVPRVNVGMRSTSRAPGSSDGKRPSS